MKSKLFTVAAILAVSGMFVSGNAAALPSGADSDTSQLTKVFPAEWSLPPEVYGVPLRFGLGSTTDYVIDRNLDDGSDLNDAWWTGGNLYYDPLENIHLDLFVGAAELNVGSVRVNTPNTTRVYLDSEPGISVGGNGKVDITQFAVFEGYPDMKLFAGGGYRFTRVDVEEIQDFSGGPVDFDLDIEVNEWQAMVGVSQRINDPIKLWFGWDGCNFAWVPYVAAQYNDLRLNISGTSILGRASEFPGQSVLTDTAESDDMVAVAVGSQIIAFGDKLSIGVEGRFIAETSISVNAHFRW